MQMNNKNFAYNQNGFSLIELMIAMAILAIGMLAAASMQYSSIRNNTKGNVFTQANMLAKAQIESLKNKDVDDLVPGSYNDAAPLNENGQPGGIYNRSWNITNFGGRSRRLTVTVQWIRQGVSDSVEISSNTRGNGV
jgi:prepilin-type N-terminal cleavage/methylation domain-containing protein